MEGFYAMRTELRGQFYALVKNREPEDRFIEFINSTLNRSNKFGFKTLEVILDLTLSVVDQTGESDYNYNNNDDLVKEDEIGDNNINESYLEFNTSYDADDEGLEENFIFPCHVIFDDCHPELLGNYHKEHLRSSRTFTQIVKYPKLCELVIEFMFRRLKDQLDTTAPDSCETTDVNNSAPSYRQTNFLANKLPPTNVDQESSRTITTKSADESNKRGNRFSSSNRDTSVSIEAYLNSIVVIIKRLNKVCACEKKNCRILSRTNILNLILKNTLHLIEELPDKQHIYLEVLLRFAFTLADYNISGDDLKQLFRIIKDENADLEVVLSSFEQLLNHHYRILKNIQPLKSINFPTASRTAEEIECNSYLSNSWHWRLRSKVIEHKRKKSRSIEKQQQQQQQQQSPEAKNLSINTRKVIQESESGHKKDVSKNPATEPEVINQKENANRIIPSWLECSLITPLSNISPLMHNGEIKLCCSMWMSLCGDLLVTDETRPKTTRGQESSLKASDWTNLNGHWLRLTSRKRSARIFKATSGGRKNSRSRRLSMRLRKRQAHDKEDEEKEELDEKVRRSEMEINQMSRSGFSRLMYSSMSIRANVKASGSLNKKSIENENKKGSNQAPPKEFLGRRARDNSQEALMHLVSFAIDTLTIEIWLNVKCMTFCARACRVAREGQTNLLDQVTFPSHLKADGSWSHIVFGLEETTRMRGNLAEKVMNLKVMVNGLHKEKEKLVYCSQRGPSTNFACLIGCERSTFGYIWKLSQINIYKNIIPVDMPIYLLGKGPDFWSFTNFRQHSTLPLPDVTQRYIKNLLNPRVLERYREIDEERALNWLTQNIVIAYFAHQPDFFLDYSSTMISSSLMNPLPNNHEFNNSAERFIQAKVLNFSRSLRFNTNHGFGSALVESGGIESVLVCFAEVIRRVQDSSAKTHSLAFSILLKMSQTNQHHLTKFLDELNGLKLTEFILAHPDCFISRQILDYYLEFCLMKRDEHSLIKSPKLVYHLLSCWRAWHKDVQIARILYKKLIRLLQPADEQILEGYYIDHNFKMMTSANSLDILMGILRECLVPLDDLTPKINHELVELIVNLISLLIKHPPGLDVILDITEFLFFLHPDPKAFVEATPERTSFLHVISIDANNKINYNSGFRSRTPHSDSSLSYRTSLDNINDNDSSSDVNSYNADGQSCGRATVASAFSNEDVFEDYDDHLRSDHQHQHHHHHHHKRSGMRIPIEQYNLLPKQPQQAMPNGIYTFAWASSANINTTGSPNIPTTQMQHTNSAQQQQHPNVKVELAQGQKCSNRNFAIANIADMLASMVKLTSTDPMKILSEALQKSIIDPRKLIILANNNSSLVREKVLRLFLSCIRACYSLNLKTVLSKYELDRKGSNFKTCIPIQLMGRQLLKYPTTSKMIQLCYGIIVGIEDFENVDTVCLAFDIETMNNNLQLNTLVMLIQLMTKLREPNDIISAVKFVHTCMEQLMILDKDDILSVLVENNLVECLMRIYFSYVEYEVVVKSSACENCDDIDDDDEEDEDDNCHVDGDKENSGDYNFNDVLKELDRTLVLIVRYFIQNLETSETIKYIDDLLTYFDLMNTYVPSKFQDILRDRQVKVLITLINYCEHYEERARRKSCGGKMEYYLRSLFKIDDLNTFSNYLSGSQIALKNLQYENDFTNETDEEEDRRRGRSKIKTDQDERLSNRTRSESEIKSDKTANSAATASPENFNDERYHNDDDLSGGSNFNSNLSDNRNHYHEDEYNNTMKISENDVIIRFRETIEFAINFIITRESGVIPSPLERRFIIKCIKLLSTYLNEYDNLQISKSLLKNTKCQWFSILNRLILSNRDGRTLRECFSLLILYLLSPSDSMNLDERKYYASELLKIFDANQLIDLLNDHANKANHKILAMFIKDLIGLNGSQFNSEDGNCEQDDECVDTDDTEEKLILLVKRIEYEIQPKENRNKKQQNGYSSWADGNNKRVRISTDNGLYLESKLCAIWMDNLKQSRENSRDKIAVLRLESQMMLDSVTTEDPNDKTNRLLDEALQITRDVVIDKNEQRKAFFEDVKQNKIYNYHIRQQWLSLIIGHTHERAIWHLEDYYPRSWELNPVEGPSRIRRRLRPCKLILESRYFRRPKRMQRNSALPESLIRQQQSDEVDMSVNSLNRLNNRRTSSIQSDLLANDWYNHYSPHPLCSMIINHEQSMDSNELRIRMFTTDKIHFNCDCSIIRPNEVCEGEVSIASWCIHFIGDRTDSYQQHIKDHLVNKYNRHSQTSNGQNVGGGGGVVDDSGYEGRANSMVTTNDELTTTGNPSSNIKTSANIRQHHHQQQTNKQSSLTTIIVEDLWFDEIVEIWDRRYQLQDVGLEIFLTNNMTYLLSFRNNRDKEEFKQSLMREQHKMINLQRFNLHTNLNRLTQFWRDGRLTNFDYLTCLNKLAGRSFNDLMQYPVFPFVLSNYTSTSLDLSQATNFRDLKKPMAIQNPEKETTFINNYQDSQTNNLSVGLCGMRKPYHYGNHYSNSATVLHFLVRLPPFTQMLIQYQDNNFDQPDRTFHSIASTWQLITRDSNTDFKELIPEFFFLPEMFLNLEQFELGLKQNNELVDDVKLPPWCPKSDARLFTLIHRQALESAHVSENLHHWIDLIFGFKQIGRPAVEAINVFHPATYYGVIDQVGQQTPTTNSLSQISSTIATLSAKSSTYGSDYISNTDMNSSFTSANMTTGDAAAAAPSRLMFHSKRQQANIERLALETMIKTYGQMPRQLFVQPMKQRSMNSSFALPGSLNIIQHQVNDLVSGSRLEPLRNIKGLRWGSYVGSPDEGEISATKQERITPEENGKENYKQRRAVGQPRNHQLDGLSMKGGHKFSLCLLPNGDIAVLRENTSLMLDYRADRKSGGGVYQPSSATSARYSRRAGLSSVARMNLFLNMIISRQQFSYIEPSQLPANQFESANASSSSLVSLTSSRAKFSPDSLSLVSWFYLDGTIRIRHPALNHQKPSVPLVQAGSVVDSVSTCCSTPELNLLLVGYESGSICAHIVSTSHETMPIAQYNSSAAATAVVNAPADALASSSAAPSAVHFLHTKTATSSSAASSGSSLSASSPSYVPLGPGKVIKNSLTGEPYTPVSLAGKTLQSVRSVNKTTRWLYCHSKRINCMRINVNFGIVVTGSDDGTCVVWDLNSLTYVRTIDYKMRLPSKRSSSASSSSQAGQAHKSQTFEQPNSSSMPDRFWQNKRLSDYLCSCNQSSADSDCDDDRGRDRNDDKDCRQLDCLSSHDAKQGCICGSGVSLIAISDTLGDIATIKDISNRIAEATDSDNDSDNMSTVSGGSDGDGDGSSSKSSNSSSSSRSTKSDNNSITSVLYCHTINGSLVGIANCQSQVKAICYSNAPEGISVNVIVVGFSDGLISLYNSWDLSRVKEFHVSGFSLPITSLLYSRDNQLLYIAYENGQLVILKSKRKSSINLPYLRIL